MERRVLYFLLQAIDSRPPCVAQVCWLKDQGYQVAVLTTGCNGPTVALLKEKGIPCHTFRPRKLPVMLFQRVVNFFNYSWTFLRFFGKYWSKNAVLWIGSEQSAYKMDRFLGRVHPVIVNALEFYESHWYQVDFGRICRNADVVTACEPNRAQFMADTFGLSRVPYVLRNKPYGAIPPKGPGSTPELQAGIRAVQGKKFLLYQGAIEADRDLSQLAGALAEADSDIFLVLTGPDKANGVAALEKIYDRVLYLGNYPAPTHLEITPYALAAVAFYKDNCLNNRYCAPNKIYEYAGCGVPMLCNPIPGLTETVGAAGAAECVDFSDGEALLAAIRRIDANRERYHRAALAFYAATDNSTTMHQILEDAFSRTKAAKE